MTKTDFKSASEYSAPSCETFEMKMNSAILDGSNYGDAGAAGGKGYADGSNDGLDDDNNF